MQSALPILVKRYLEKRAEKKWISRNVQKLYNVIVVIPVITEFENIPKLLDSLSKSSTHAKQKSLILFSINNSEEAHEEIKENNLKTINLLKSLCNVGNKYDLNIDFVDASTAGNGLPAKDAGVGLARKIGMDQSLLIFDYNHENNLIVCLDGDCEVEENYLSTLQQCASKKNKTGVIKYAHVPDNEAIVNYEIFLRYYVLGLKYANSPYAYHSIGSCIVVDPITYVKIGGMNKKKAGEDFYFLEKAAKIVSVSSINETTVIPSSRKSWRVPFGTGQRMNRFYEKVKNEYVLYDPTSFKILGEFLKIYFNGEIKDPALLIEKARDISKSLKTFLEENNFIASQQKIIDNSKTPEQLFHQRKLWFDSFKTLKLVHYLRDNGYPEQPMFVALNELFDSMNISSIERHYADPIPPLQKQIEYLNVLRELT